jgi:protein required for attachment to host cells
MKSTDDFMAAAEITEGLSKKGLDRAWTELAIALAQAPRIAGTVRQALKSSSGDTSELQSTLSRIAKQVTDANKEFQGLHREFKRFMEQS